MFSGQKEVLPSVYGWQYYRPVWMCNLLTRGGGFFNNTSRACSTRLEKRGPMGTKSVEWKTRVSLVCRPTIILYIAIASNKTRTKTRQEDVNKRVHIKSMHCPHCDWLTQKSFYIIHHHTAQLGFVCILKYLEMKTINVLLKASSWNITCITYPMTTAFDTLRTLNVLTYSDGVATFLMAWHLAVSEKPIILSGEQILMKGNWESSAILAASAVLPLWGGPEGAESIHTLSHIRFQHYSVCLLVWTREQE